MKKSTNWLKFLTIACAVMIGVSIFIIKSAVANADSKVLPKAVKLAQDSQSDKYGEVAFDHDTHSFKNYSIDGTRPITCVECHHTDTPQNTLKAPFVTSNRLEILTVESLKKPGVPDVRDCRTCHFQVHEGKPVNAKLTYTKEKPSATGQVGTKELNSEFIYHENCNSCHDAAIKARPALKGKIPGGADCLKCHAPVQ